MHWMRILYDLLILNLPYQGLCHTWLSRAVLRMEMPCRCELMACSCWSQLPATKGTPQYPPELILILQVAVRMRVFNGREKAANATRIVRMENLDKGSKTYIADPDTGEERCNMCSFICHRTPESPYCLDYDSHRCGP